MSTHFRTYSHEADPEKGLRLHTTSQGNAEPVTKVQEPGSGDKEVHRSVENVRYLVSFTLNFVHER